MTENIVHETNLYKVVLDVNDKDGLWYHIVNKEYNLVESKESLKPQALVFCEQFNILLEQGTHKQVAENMTIGMRNESLLGYPTDVQSH